jgi:uncharacterized membrane protein
VVPFSPSGALTAAAQPGGAGYDLLVLLHVALAMAGLGTLVVSGCQALRLARLPPADPLPPSLARYYAPGVNWAGRLLYGVPITGFALVTASGGSYALRDAWITAGLVLWFAAAIGAEVLLWPAERRIQVLVHRGAAGDAAGSRGREVHQRSRAVCAECLVAASVIVVATVLMFAKP